MKNYKVIVTEIKTVEFNATAPSEFEALKMARTLKTQTTILDNIPDAESQTVYRVFDNNEEETTAVSPCDGDCDNCPFADDDDEDCLEDEIS